MTLEKTYWMKKIEEGLAETLSVPLWGKSPPFPWEELSRHVAKMLQTEHLKITPRAVEQRAPHEMTAGLGTHPIVFSFELAPLEGSLFWIFSTDDLHKLTTFALSSNKKIKGLSDPRLQEGFYRFLCLEMVHLFEELRPFQDLALRMTDEGGLPEEAALCIDVAIQLGDRQTLWGRVVCSTELHRSFKSYYLQQPAPLLSHALAKEINVGVSITVGKTSLPIEAWKQVAVGDLLLLDRFSYDLRAHKGNGTLFLNNSPLLQVKIKGDTLKILDYAFYYEDNKAMQNNDSEEGNSEEMNFSGEEIEGAAPEHLWEAKEEQELSSEKMFSPDAVPFVLHVEVARLKMSLEKLLKLEPGNVLDLSTRPEQGVFLTVDGKRIAKGELVQLGETLGVKILQIGE